MDNRVKRAKWLLANIKHAAMATVNEDGSPHNTPYFFMASSGLEELYWGSHPDSLHSINIVRTGKLFVVLYEANEVGGLYIECTNGRIAENDELERALARHNELRKSLGSDELPKGYYESPSEQRMWLCDTNKFWINEAERDDNGKIRVDKRQPVTRLDLT
ncbi:MAG TPA: hypothetical protein VLE69_02350 [Candidatus Saccharimonadales bacterium]|nr:hypothetical protein [Candidatus Saccharimonadales bacterium]